MFGLSDAIILGLIALVGAWLERRHSSAMKRQDVSNDIASKKHTAQATTSMAQANALVEMSAVNNEVARILRDINATLHSNSTAMEIVASGSPSLLNNINETSKQVSILDKSMTKGVERIDRVVAGVADNRLALTDGLDRIERSLKQANEDHIKGVGTVHNRIDQLVTSVNARG